MTTGEITKEAIRILGLMGHEVWRQNNTRAVRGRIFTGRKGVSDVLGFERSTGIFTLCETKNKGDKLSDDQIELLTKAFKAGCHCFIAGVDKKGGFELKKYNPNQ